MCAIRYITALESWGLGVKKHWEDAFGINFPHVNKNLTATQVYAFNHISISEFWGLVRRNVKRVIKPVDRHISAVLKYNGLGFVRRIRRSRALEWYWIWSEMQHDVRLCLFINRGHSLCFLLQTEDIEQPGMKILEEGAVKPGKPEAPPKPNLNNWVAENIKPGVRNHQMV